MNVETVKGVFHAVADGAVIVIAGVAYRLVRSLQRRLGRLEIIIRYKPPVDTPDPSRIPVESQTNPGVKLADIMAGKLDKPRGPP